MPASSATWKRAASWTARWNSCPATPSSHTLAHDGKGLTRPELAVLLAYAKLDLDAEILASTLPDDPALTPLLAGYFPPAGREGVSRRAGRSIA